MGHPKIGSILNLTVSGTFDHHPGEPTKRKDSKKN